MHPILTSGQRRLLYLASWVLIGLLLAVAWSAASPGVRFPVALAVVVPPSVFYGFVCLSAWYEGRHATARQPERLRQAERAASLGVCAAEAA